MRIINGENIQKGGYNPIKLLKKIGDAYKNIYNTKKSLRTLIKKGGYNPYRNVSNKIIGPNTVDLSKIGINVVDFMIGNNSISIQEEDLVFKSGTNDRDFEYWNDNRYKMLNETYSNTKTSFIVIIEVVLILSNILFDNEKLLKNIISNPELEYLIITQINNDILPIINICIRGSFDIFMYSISLFYMLYFGPRANYSYFINYLNDIKEIKKFKIADLDTKNWDSFIEKYNLDKYGIIKKSDDLKKYISENKKLLDIIIKVILQFNKTLEDNKN